MKTKKVVSCLMLVVVACLALAKADLTSNLESTSTLDPTLLTDKTTYAFGEPVIFSGEGYLPEGTKYRIDITKGLDTYGSLEFDSATEGTIPDGVEWLVEEGVPLGLYTAVAYNITDPDNAETYEKEVSRASFIVSTATLETDKEEYIVEEEVVFSGIGYTPEMGYYIDIAFDSEVIATLPFDSDTEGKIPDGIEWLIPFDAVNGIYDATAYSIDEPGVPLASTKFYVDASIAALTEAIFRELDALNDSITADVGGIKNSLVKKLNVTARKIEQCLAWVDEGKNKTAANMLKASANNLKAFIHHVEAQRGKHIDEETADSLIAQAKALIDKIEATSSSLTIEDKGKKDSNMSQQEQEQEQDQNTDNGHGKGHDKDNGKENGKENGKGKGKNK